MKFTIALIATVCVASSAAAPVRQRTETQYKSAVKSDENYDPYMGIGGQRELEGSMSMTTDGSIPLPEDDHHEDDGHHHEDDGHDHDQFIPTGEEEEKVDSTDKSSGFAAGTTVSALAAAGAMMLL